MRLVMQRTLNVFSGSVATSGGIIDPIVLVASICSDVAHSCSTIYSVYDFSSFLVDRDCGSLEHM